MIKLFKNFTPQLKVNRSKIISILIISCFLIGAVIGIHLLYDIAISDMMRDVTAIAEVPFYTGFFSQIGILIWIIAATLCLFCAGLNYNITEVRAKGFMFFSGLLSLFLCLDDLFSFHEEVFPYYLNISENVIYFSYIILVSFIFVRYYRFVLRTNFILLLMAFLFLGSSLIVDMLRIKIYDPSLIEDSLKMFGIVAWFFYYYDCTRTLVTQHLRVEKSPS